MIGRLTLTILPEEKSLLMENIGRAVLIVGLTIVHRALWRASVERDARRVVCAAARTRDRCRRVGR